MLGAIYEESVISAGLICLKSKTGGKIGISASL